MKVSGQLHAPTALLPGTEPLVPIGRKLGGPQSRSGGGGEEKNSQLLPGLEPQIIQPVAQRYSTELSRLLQIKRVFFLIKQVNLCYRDKFIYRDIAYILNTHICRIKLSSVHS
jgi:hypothetical protein